MEKETILITILVFICLNSVLINAGSWKGISGTFYDNFDTGSVANTSLWSIENHGGVLTNSIAASQLHYGTGFTGSGNFVQLSTNLSSGINLNSNGIKIFTINNQTQYSGGDEGGTMSWILFDQHYNNVTIKSNSQNGIFYNTSMNISINLVTNNASYQFIQETGSGAILGNVSLSSLNPTDRWGFRQQISPSNANVETYLDFLFYSNVTSPGGNINAILSSPSNLLTLNGIGSNFTANYTIFNAAYNFTNTTYYVWNSLGNIFNTTTLLIKGNESNTTTLFIDAFSVGDYKWNVYVCGSNLTFTNCSFAPSNYTFTVGTTINSINYNNYTYETAQESFSITLNLFPGSQISLAQLVYNGTIYVVSNLTITSTTATLSKTIDVPLNINKFTNQTNSFYFKLTYNGGITQTLPVYTQNVGFINLQLCNATYNIAALNLSVLDEQTGTAVNVAFNSFFYYWLGSGSYMKTYNFSDNSLSNSQFNFCKQPNINLHTNLDSTYTNPLYLPREYHLVNATLTNDSSLISLQLLNLSIGLKFYFTVLQGGGNPVGNSLVQISKYVVANGSYIFNSNRITDDNGKFIEYLQQDAKYIFIVSKNGVLLGLVNQTATCTASPCEISLYLNSGNGAGIFDAYYGTYAQNILSNISFDINSKIVTYTFSDLTGLANYFRFEVSQTSYNATTKQICNVYAYSTSGTLICNVTGYDGDFIAKGYISRSPEILDKVLVFVINILNTVQTSPYIVLFLIGWIITITFGALAVSRGNPSTTLAGFIISWTSSKLMAFNPFSWVVIALVDLLCVWVIYEVNT